MKVSLQIERWSLAAPVAITGYVFSELQLLLVTLVDGDCFGRGEAYGVYYRDETAESMVRQVESVRDSLERGVTLEELLTLLPPGGARNAVDCALWEIESQRARKPVWRLAGMEDVRPILTTCTLWGADPEVLAQQSAQLAGTPAIKLKLLGDGEDAARVAAVRAALPDASLCVDANQGFSRDGFIELLDSLLAARVHMVEQPFPVGKEAWMEGLSSPIPIAADESFQCLADLDAIAERFDMVNIKLDKCGGLTEALLIAERAHELDLQVMVGCMTSTSLSMAPAFIAAQRAELADVDGPLYLASDRRYGAKYANGYLTVPDELWGMHSRPWHRESA